MRRCLAVPLCIALLCGLSTPAMPAVPHDAYLAAADYRHLLERYARREFGLEAPLALLAGQIHQESAWRPSVCSHAGACGLGQVMPATGRWLPEVCAGLGPPIFADPEWSIRALTCFDGRLYRASAYAATECDRWAFALAAYNGGPGNLAKDRRLAVAAGGDATRWWGHVERYTSRSAAARRENREYPRRILYTWQPAYLARGWPGPEICYG